MSADPQSREPELVGPYAIHDEIGSGGMATVHLGQLRSTSGFTRIVAIKRMHSELARSPEFVSMFLQEARLASRIQHPNVVAALDWIATDTQAFLIMEYVHGVSLDQALRWTGETSKRVPITVASSLLIGTLLGLHAAHEAVDENGKNLGIVHRDVSPHNVLVGVDGLARVLDFGIAKAAERAQHTKTGEVKGKLGYIAPEQLFHDRIGREADIYSVGVMLWEIVVGRRLFEKESQGQMLMRIANNQLDTPRSVAPDVSPEVEAVIMKALAPLPESRYRTALEFATALETVVPPASQRIVGQWLAAVANDALSRRSELKLRIEGAPVGPVPDRGTDASGEYVQRTATGRGELTTTGAGFSGPIATTPRESRGGHKGLVIGALAIAAAAALATAMFFSTRNAHHEEGATAVAAPLAPKPVETVALATATAVVPVATATPPASAAATTSEPTAEATANDAALGVSNAETAHGGAVARPEFSRGNGSAHFGRTVRPQTSAAPSASVTPVQHGSELDSIGGRE
ncbi:MAG TPA: serine/threonine-protein kinase [Polyangiaceae bacterium]|nr:serine/threonine-protein kinase [Polyangiaceae bacterium]